MSRKKGADAGEEKIVLEYLEQQNRPFSVQNIVDALQKDGVKKTAVERSLAGLLQSGKVACKEYGKAKIYLFCQSSIEIPPPEKMAEMDAEIARKAAELKSFDADVFAQKQLNSALQSELTESKAKELVSENKAAIEQNKTTLDQLGDGSDLLSKEEMERIELSLFKAKNEWKKRKRMVIDSLNQISESMDKKRRALEEEIGIENDEEAVSSRASLSLLLVLFACIPILLQSLT